MIQKGLSLLSVLCALFSFAQKKPYAYTYKYPVSDLEFDLAILKESLKKVHPGLYWFQSEKEFAEKCDYVKDSIQTPRTEFEFYTMLLPLIANIKCSHTDIAPSLPLDKLIETKFKFFPFATNVIDGKSYIAKNYTPDTSIKIGSQILSINGISTEDIIKRFSNQTWGDGYEPNYLRFDENFPLCLLYAFKFPDTYDLNVVEADGNKKQVHAAAMRYRDVYKVYATRYPKPKTKSLYHLTYIDSLKTAVLKIDAFMGKGYKKFLAQTFKELNEKKTENLVIDLRGNPGGDDENGRLLFQYIALSPFFYYNRLEIILSEPSDTIYKYARIPGHKDMLKLTKPDKDGTRILTKSVNNNLTDTPFEPMKDNFKGKVYVLNDYITSSASTEFAAVTHYQKRGILIGQRTNGGYGGNTSGSECILTLPKTGIRVVIPIVRYFCAVECPLGQSVIPNIEIKKEPAQLDKKTDPEMNAALDLILKK